MWYYPKSVVQARAWDFLQEAEKGKAQAEVQQQAPKATAHR